MTKDEFESTIRDICPHCKAGIKVRQRDDTKEFVHDIFRGTAISHGICLATHFRAKWKDNLDG
jgi:hypothetical protein